jgi:hypothetical protein
VKCPHCNHDIHAQIRFARLDNEFIQNWSVSWQSCPNCQKIILWLNRHSLGSRLHQGSVEEVVAVYPRSTARAPLPPEVPELFAKDYLEACAVIAESPKASAALSRRCLQNLIREKANVKKGNLSNEIQQVLDSKELPQYLATALDAVRNIGNFAAHTIKSTNSGEIIDVEHGEADWSLNLLESLFDFYFVQPIELKRKQDALNKKLQEAGKPPLKGTAAKSD